MRDYTMVNAESPWERIKKVGMIKRENNGSHSTAIFKKRRAIEI